MKMDHLKDIKKYYDAHRLAKEVEQIVSGKKQMLEDCPEINRLIEENRFSSEFFKNITNEERFRRSYDEILLERNNKEKNIKLLSHKIEKRKTIYRIVTFATSATIAAAIAVLSFFFYEEPDLIEKQEVATKLEAAVIRPTLILSNGENINIVANNTIKVQEYIPATSLTNSIKRDSIEYNTIKVPHMYTLNVELCDGTVVRLNANSELKYPITFVGEKREVFLKGEAYFDVTKSEKPFIVNTSTILVKVYGTKFNINTHKKDLIETILISGSIGVTINDSCEKEIMIKPNQCFQLSKKNKQFEVKEVETAIYTTWMSGYLSCHNTNLYELLDEISLWYGVEFILDQNVDKDQKITISQRKDLSISDLISILEDITDLQFIKKEETKYYVK